MSRNQTTHEAKKQILKAAIEEFAEKGIGQARTAEIAKKANVASGLVHYHFKSKDNLYREVIDLMFDTTFADELAVFPYHEKITIAQKLHLVLYSFTKVLIKTESIDFLKLIYRVLIEGGEQLNETIKNYDFFPENYIANILKQGEKEGVFEINNAILLAFNIIDLISDQVLRHELLKDSNQFKKIYGDNFENDLMEFQIFSTFKLINPAKSELIIPPIPDDLKNMMDSIIDTYLKKSVIGSYSAILKIISKIIPDNI